MNELVSEFFYEGIRRIIPGLALIITCFHSQAQNCFHNHREFFAAPIFFAVCLIALAWPLGILIDSLTYFIPVMINDLYLIKSHPKCWLTKFIAEASSRPTPPKIERETSFQRDFRRQKYLVVVTKDMCRCLVGVCLFRYFLFLFFWIDAELFKACHHPCQCCVAGLDLCHFFIHRGNWIYLLLALAFLFPWVGEYWEIHFLKIRKAYLQVHEEKDYEI
jgi:hypothetical protein